ncbi:hypothetical protein H6G97_18235 [Nostoc flagelliforme FACHB-838]|uniref:Uncharacterized protein n=1 Tax=Nostoc flagelliforme FACHB-838 TaxID=2692904 RepID=A0ABR8DSD5_9NOSO|nr:hypothetical protein [Nostoc flagelliforme]MBD2531419.1 hypothetical protein [Nostoc flagelliforme FACHB-838]
MTKFSLKQLLGMAFAFLQRLQQPRIYTFSILFAVGLGLTLALSAYFPRTSDNSATPQTTQATTASATTVRIGFQKASTLLYGLKARGELEIKDLSLRLQGAG